LKEVVPVVSNGNVKSPCDVINALEHTAAHGVMSAEGILADPAIFRRALQMSPNNGDEYEGHDRPSSGPDRATLFDEYCELSEAYARAGGWTAIDSVHIQNGKQEESKQMYIARQHLTWMLEKSGHGGCVRYKYAGTFKKHTHLLWALKEASTLNDLRVIANDCLTGVYGSGPFEP
jgi:tRNA-dihydrouridine synthase